MVHKENKLLTVRIHPDSTFPVLLEWLSYCCCTCSISVRPEYWSGSSSFSSFCFLHGLCACPPSLPAHQLAVHSPVVIAYSGCVCVPTPCAPPTMHKHVCSSVFCVGPTADMLPITNHGPLPAPLLFWGLQYLVEKQTSAGKEDDFQYLGWRISPSNLSPDLFKDPTNLPLLLTWFRRRKLTCAVFKKLLSVIKEYINWCRWWVFIKLNIIHQDMSVLVNAHITFILLLLAFVLSESSFRFPPSCLMLLIYFLSCCCIEHVSVVALFGFKEMLWGHNTDLKECLKP